MCAFLTVPRFTFFLLRFLNYQHALLALRKLANIFWFDVHREISGPRTASGTAITCRRDCDRIGVLGSALSFLEVERPAPGPHAPPSLGKPSLLCTGGSCRCLRISEQLPAEGFVFCSPWDFRVGCFKRPSQMKVVKRTVVAVFFKVNSPPAPPLATLPSGSAWSEW